MLQLIKLELKKGRFGSYLWGSIIAYFAIAAFVGSMYSFGASQIEEIPFTSMTELLTLIDLVVRGTFIIYASVLLTKLIINEFKDNTISLMFTYPISRRKLIFAKLAMVFGWTFANVVIANLLLDALFVSINSVFQYIPDPLTTELLLNHSLTVLMQAFGAAGMSLLPLVIGLPKKSVPMTITSSIVIVMVVCSNNSGFSLSSIIAIPLSLAVLGIFITYLSFRNIDHVDIG